MKLLLDQNLSYRLVAFLESDYPGTQHVSHLDLVDVPDKAIWEYAKHHDYIVVTQDVDFLEYSILYGGPPLVVWLKFGNSTRQLILEKLLDHKTLLKEALLSPEAWCVEIY